MSLWSDLHRGPAKKRRLDRVPVAVVDRDRSTHRPSRLVVPRQRVSVPIRGADGIAIGLVDPDGYVRWGEVNVVGPRRLLGDQETSAIGRAITAIERGNAHVVTHDGMAHLVQIED